MDIEGFKFNCVSKRKLIGPNEIPFWEFTFQSVEVPSKDLSDDDKLFLSVTQGKLALDVLSESYFEVGKIYEFGFKEVEE